MEKNLTSGSVFKNMMMFSLPYLLSYFLQTLYGMADLFIIGQFEGVASTTAVSVGSQVMHMLTVILVGLAMGTTVAVGQAVGAGDLKKASSGNRQYGDAVFGSIGGADSGSLGVCPADRGDHFHAGGSGGGNHPLPDYLLYRHSIYHGV